MSYNISLYRFEVKEKYLASDNIDDFFDEHENMLPFSKEQKEYLKKRLENYGYKIEIEKNGQFHYHLPKDGSQSVLLTDRSLHFSTTSSDTFDISMTSSEFTDDGYLAKFDPQFGGWEESQ